MTHKFALPEPDDCAKATDDGSVFELTRVWMGPNGPAIICRPIFEDPRSMGEMLAELCWHFAFAYEQTGRFSNDEAKALLKAGWDQGHLNGEAAASKRNSQ